MKLHTDRNEVERTNVASESAFRIKTTAKAFDILSSGLYTDRILAVVRELSCNAYDAHVAAGNKKPFEIHLPNALEPWFHVKDQGTGLSDEDVMNLYSTYFDSTKTTSNDYIGALGLGSKSPFSYTKAFEVISRFEHVRRMYSVFINEDGVPTIARLGEFVTDEPNGLEVRVTVKKDDFWTFQEKVRKALRWFPVKPTIVGASRFDWPEMPKESLSGEGWAMFDSDFTDDYSKMTAVQGNVAYKVDISKLELGEADVKLLENCHIAGFFGIGELEVAASREEIRYDDRSREALIKRVEGVRAGILRSVEAQVQKLEDDGKSLWDITIALNKMANEMFGNTSLFNEFIHNSWNKAIQWYIENEGTMKLPEIHGHNLVAYTMTRGGDPMKAQIKRSYPRSGINPDDDVAIFVNDMKTGGVSKVTHFLRTTGHQAGIRTAVVLTQSEVNLYEKPVPDAKTKLADTGKRIEWTDEEYEEEFESIIESLGNVEFKLASTDAPAPPRGRNGDYKAIPVFQFEKVNIRRYGKSTIVWQRVPSDKLDLTKDSLYFFIRNGSTITILDKAGNEKDISWDVSRTKEDLENAIRLINDAQGTSYTMKNVFAVGSMAAKKVKKLPNWVNLFDALKTQMAQYKPAVEYFKKVANTADNMGIRDCITNNRHKRAKLIECVEALGKKSAFKLALMPLIEDTIKFETMLATSNLMIKLDVDLGTEIFDNLNIKGYYAKNAFSDYPMLSFVNQYQYLDSKQIDLFFDYVQTIDRS